MMYYLAVMGVLFWLPLIAMLVVGVSCGIKRGIQAFLVVLTIVVLLLVGVVSWGYILNTDPPSMSSKVMEVIRE